MDWLYFALLSAFLGGIAYVVEKKSLLKEHTLDFIAIHLIFTLLLGLFLIPQVTFGIPLKAYILIFIISFTSTVGFIYLTKSIRHMEVSSAIPLISFLPAIVAVLSFIILKETLRLNHLLGIGLLAIGAYGLESTTKHFDLLGPFRVIFKSRYIHFIFIALALYSVSRVLERFMLFSSTSLKVSPFTLMFFTIVFSTVTVAVILLISKRKISHIKASFKRSYIVILIVSLLFFAGKITRLFAVSLPVENVGMVSAVVQLSILISVLLGGEIFHEGSRFKRIMTTLIMLAGVYLVVT